MTRCNGPSENEGKRIYDPGLGEYEIKNGVRQWIMPNSEMQERIDKDRLMDARANQWKVYRRIMR